MYTTANTDCTKQAEKLARPHLGADVLAPRCRASQTPEHFTDAAADRGLQLGAPRVEAVRSASVRHLKALYGDRPASRQPFADRCLRAMGRQAVLGFAAS